MNIDFLKVCSDVTKTARKIPQSQYLSSGQYPIFDQGQKTISGYYNDAGNIANDFPYIVFGDHTRVLKYVNEPCYIGADGVKLLKIINNDFVPKYVFYALLANPVNSQGYSRHFKFLKEKKIKIASKKEQRFVVEKLDSIKESIELKENELKSLDELVKSRFIEMFGNPMDEMKWNSTFTEVVIFNPKKSEVKKDMEIEASFVPMEAIGTDGSFSIRKSGKIKDFYKGYTYFKDGDVIFAKITPCFENGKIAIANHCANKIGFGTTEFHVARPIPGKTNAEWIMNLLRNDSLHTYASSKMTGSAGQKRIQTPFFEKLGVYLPPLELQNSFADFVHLVDKSKVVCYSKYFLWLNLTFVSSTIAYSNVVSILE